MIGTGFLFHNSLGQKNTFIPSGNIKIMYDLSYVKKRRRKKIASLVSLFTAVGITSLIIISFLGVGAVAIPTGIISAGFVEQYTQAQNSTSMIDDIHLHTMIVDLDSKWIGMSAADLMEGENVIIVVAKRGDITIVPNQNYRIELGDELVAYHTDRLVVQ